MYGSSREKMFSIRPSVTSNSSLSFKNRELRFCMLTAHTLAKQVINKGILEILSEAEI